MTKHLDIETLDDATSSVTYLPEQVELDGVPDIRQIPVRCQQMLALLAVGFSYQRIGELFGISKQAVHDMRRRYDPESRIALSKDARRRFLAQMMLNVACRALAEITPEKLAGCSAKDLALIATSVGKVSERMQEAGTGTDTGRRVSRTGSGS